MRLGPYLAAVVVSFISPGVAHADELMRLCGPRGVGFIRTANGQACLYSPETRTTAPTPSAPASQPTPQSTSASPSQPAASGKP